MAVGAGLHEKENGPKVARIKPVVFDTLGTVMNRLDSIIAEGFEVLALAVGC